MGDNFVVEFAATGEQELEIAGLFDNKSLVQSDYVLAIPTYEAHFPEKVGLQVFVKVADGVNLSTARKAIEGALDDYPALQLEDQTETRRSWRPR